MPGYGNIPGIFITDVPGTEDKQHPSYEHRLTYFDESSKGNAFVFRLNLGNSNIIQKTTMLSKAAK